MSSGASSDVDTPLALLAELAAVGVDVENVWDLVNTSSPYPTAIPVLLTWLADLENRVPSSSRPMTESGLVRSLAVREARPVAWPVLAERFRRAEDPSGTGFRWQYANSMSVVADDSVYDELAMLISDSSYGRARETLVEAVARSKRPESTALLISLLADWDLGGLAARALGRRKVVAALPALAILRDSGRNIWSKDAAKAITRIEQAEARAEEASR